MIRLGSLVVFLGLATTVLCAPVIDGERRHRESTKAILNLESQLKQQAGENKKFFPSDLEGLPAKAAEVEAMAEQEAEAADESESGDGEDKSIQEEEDDTLAKSDNAIDYEYVKRGDLSADEEEGDLPQVPFDSFTGDVRKLEVPEEDEDDEDEGDDEDDEDEDEEDYGEDEELFMQNVMETLQEHPEWLEELMKDEDLPADYISSDEGDKEDAMKAEYLAAMNEQHQADENDTDEDDEDDDSDEFDKQYAKIPYPYTSYYEQTQNFDGDSTAHVVAKKKGYQTPDDYLDFVNYINSQQPQNEEAEDEDSLDSSNEDAEELEEEEPEIQEETSEEEDDTDENDADELEELANYVKSGDAQEAAIDKRFFM